MTIECEPHAALKPLVEKFSCRCTGDRVLLWNYTHQWGLLAKSFILLKMKENKNVRCNSKGGSRLVQHIGQTVLIGRPSWVPENVSLIYDTTDSAHFHFYLINFGSLNKNVYRNTSSQFPKTESMQNCIAPCPVYCLKCMYNSQLHILL